MALSALIDFATPQLSRRLIAIPRLGLCPLSSMVSVPVSTSLAVVWAVMRHEDWSWILQVCGVCLCGRFRDSIAIPCSSPSISTSGDTHSGHSRDLPDALCPPDAAIDQPQGATGSICTVQFLSCVMACVYNEV